MKKFFAVILLVASLAFTGCANKQAIVDFISTDAAKKMVLEATGVDLTDAKILSVEMKEKNDTEYYQITVETPEGKYRFDVDALTGRIIDKKQIKEEVKAEKIENKKEKKVEKKADKELDEADTKDNEKSNSTANREVTSQGNRAMISASEAKKIALKHAGLTENDVVFVKSGLDKDDGNKVYDIEFYNDSGEYDYEIDPYTGKIVNFDYDAEYYFVSPDKEETTENDNNKNIISAGLAKKIALEHAGLTEDKVKFIKRELDKSNEHSIYEVEFYTENKEYDYEIDAVTGEILDFDYDAEAYELSENNDKKNKEKNKAKSNANKAINAAQAKKKALSQVPGAKMSDIIEFETDNDDGKIEYEGKIYYKNMEYEFEIDGYSGAIRSWDVEPIDDD